jgi:hypothetical protein
MTLDSSAGPAPHVPEPLKAALKVVVAEEWALDPPRGLSSETTAQTGFYTHRAQADWGSSKDRGSELLPTPPPRSRPRGRGRTRGVGRQLRRLFSGGLEIGNRRILMQGGKVPTAPTAVAITEASGHFAACVRNIIRTRAEPAMRAVRSVLRGTYWERRSRLVRKGPRPVAPDCP